MRLYPAKVIAVNGSASGPYTHGRASSFDYDLQVVTDQGSTIVRGIKPQERRWPDEVDVWPFTPPEVVLVYEIGGRLYMKDAERVPYFAPCGAAAR